MVGSWLFEVANRLALKVPHGNSLAATARERDRKEGADGEQQKWIAARIVQRAGRGAAELAGMLSLTLVALLPGGSDARSGSSANGLVPANVASPPGYADWLCWSARLTARDLTLSSVLVSAELAQQTVSAHLSATLLRDTVHASLAFSLHANAVRLPAAVLAEEGLKSMAVAKGKMMLTLLLAVGAIATGAGVLTQRQVDAMRADEKIAVGTPEPLHSQPSKVATETSAEPRAEAGACPRAWCGWNELAARRQVVAISARWQAARATTNRRRSARYFCRAVRQAAGPDSRADVPGRREVIGSTMAFTRDGKYLAAVCWEGRCGIWETATGRLVRWLESGPFYSIVQCDFSPDGKLLAVGQGHRREGSKALLLASMRSPPVRDSNKNIAR